MMYHLHFPIILMQWSTDFFFPFPFLLFAILIFDFLGPHTARAPCAPCIRHCYQWRQVTRFSYYMFPVCFCLRCCRNEGRKKVRFGLLEKLGLSHLMLYNTCVAVVGRCGGGGLSQWHRIEGKRMGKGWVIKLKLRMGVNQWEQGNVSYTPTIWRVLSFRSDSQFDSDRMPEWKCLF